MTTRLVPLVLLGLVWAPAAYAWSWPVQGPVLQPFSYDPAHPYAAGQHRGVDVGAPTGSQVLAPAAGTVTFAGTVPTSGHCVTIETADGYSVTLTQLGAILVARGATVAEGDAVATVGPSGTPELEVPYVHLGIRVASDPNGYVDPLTLLPALAPLAAPDTASPPAAATVPPAASSGAAPPAASPAPPAALTPAPPGTAPEAPVPAATAPVPTAGVATVPATAPHATAPVVRATRTEGTPVRQPATRSEPQSRPAPMPVHARASAKQPVAIAGGAGVRVQAGATPHRVAAAPSPVRHRPVPVPASPRERQPIDARPISVLPLALGAGAGAVAIAALLGILRLRRRRAPAPEPSAVVIPLPRRPERVEERRAA